MIDRDYCRVMARYNQWMNQRLYALCETLGDEQRRRNLGAFFRSIHGTLNHLLWADQVWMSRLGERPRPPVAIGETLHDDFPELWQARADMDQEILQWADAIDTAQLFTSLEWTSGVDGVTRSRPTGLLVVHLFNHQTHHRGQVTALLTRLGHDPGVTDLPWMPGVETIEL